AYKVFEHQHEREVKAAWGRAATTKGLPALSFVPQSAPLVRGIYACCYLVFEGEPPADVAGAYRRRYEGERFVRVVKDVPNVRDVAGTNNADIFVRDDFGVTLVISTVDNLVKGAAGQAVQCLNLGFGLAEDAGLKLAGALP